MATPIKVDPKRLLGFKIIAGSEGVTALHSPKIGVKGCPVVAPDVSTGVPLTASGNTTGKEI